MTLEMLSQVVEGGSHACRSRNQSLNPP